jgi:hypothetical protein
MLARFNSAGNKRINKYVTKTVAKKHGKNKYCCQNSDPDILKLIKGVKTLLTPAEIIPHFNPHMSVMLMIKIVSRYKIGYGVRSIKKMGIKTCNTAATTQKKNLRANPANLLSIRLL